MTDNAELRLKNPAYPGAFVEVDIIEPLNLSVTDSGEVVEITRAAFSSLLNGRSSLSPETALQIEKAFGMSTNTLMRIQCSFDIAQARKRAGAINVVRFVPKAKHDPQPKLI